MSRSEDLLAKFSTWELAVMVADLEERLARATGDVPCPRHHGEHPERLCWEWRPAGWREAAL